MIERRERLLITVLFFVIVAVSVLLVSRLFGDGEAEKVYRVSVIANYAPDEQWKNFRKGMDQAALDRNVDVHFLMPGEENAAEQQIELIEREIKNSTDAVVIFAADDEIIGNWFSSFQPGVPVVAVGTQIESERQYRYVGCDDVEVGHMLAEKIAESGFHDSVVFIRQDMQGYLTDRLLALTERLEQLGISCKTVSVSGTGEPLDVYLTSEGPCAVASVEASITESLARAAFGRESIGVFGVGTSSEMIGFLEEGAIRALVVSSEYDVGYLAVINAVEAASGVRQTEFGIRSYVATGENMFEDPVVKILVPIS